MTIDVFSTSTLHSPKVIPTLTLQSCCVLQEKVNIKLYSNNLAFLIQNGRKWWSCRRHQEVDVAASHPERSSFGHRTHVDQLPEGRLGETRRHRT